MVDRVSRSYDDSCGIARALDLVGERWALLVVRELAFSSKRFADLRRGLGSVSPNVLTQRLGELEHHEIVRRTVLGPPVGATVYELTDRGRRLLPVLDSLAHFGSRLPITSERELSRDALLFAMRSTVRADRPAPPRVQVVLDGIHWDAVIESGALDWQPPTGTPGATLQTTTSTLRELVFAGLDLDRAIADGRACVSGAASDVRAFVAAFERPQLWPEEPRAVRQI